MTNRMYARTNPHPAECNTKDTETTNDHPLFPRHQENVTFRWKEVGLHPHQAEVVERFGTRMSGWFPTLKRRSWSADPDSRWGKGALFGEPAINDPCYPPHFMRMSKLLIYISPPNYYQVKVAKIASIAILPDFRTLKLDFMLGSK